MPQVGKGFTETSVKLIAMAFLLNQEAKQYQLRPEAIGMVGRFCSRHRIHPSTVGILQGSVKGIHGPVLDLPASLVI
jgi:hypothetical protein